MRLNIVIIAFIFYTCDKFDNAPYLDKWVGRYAGTEISYTRHPSGNMFVTFSDTHHIEVLVERGTLDSSLSIQMQYFDTIVSKLPELKFEPTGFFQGQLEGKNGVNSLKIQFVNDSMDYSYMERCGIPCETGNFFNIGRK